MPDPVARALEEVATIVARLDRDCRRCRASDEHEVCEPRLDWTELVAALRVRAAELDPARVVLQSGDTTVIAELTEQGTVRSCEAVTPVRPWPGG